MCASCQCYILSNHALIGRSADEDAMLAEAFHVKDSSRLGCQIYIKPELEGLVIELAPDRQQYIDQAQSLNLFFRPDAHIKYLHAIHFMAWKKGLKTQHLRFA